MDSLNPVSDAPSQWQLRQVGENLALYHRLAQDYYLLVTL